MYQLKDIFLNDFVFWKYFSLVLWLGFILIFILLLIILLLILFTYSKVILQAVWHDFVDDLSNCWEYCRQFVLVFGVGKKIGNDCPISFFLSVDPFWLLSLQTRRNAIIQNQTSMKDSILNKSVFLNTQD